MAQIIIEIPDEQVERVLSALAQHYDWDGEGNRAAFVKAGIIARIKRHVLSQERDNAARAAAAVGEPDLE